MAYNPEAIEKLKAQYIAVKDVIASRLEEFRALWKSASEERLFAEMAFCLLTPQSKARTCWSAVENMVRDNVLLTAPHDVIESYLVGVRFKRNKASYIVEAREKFCKNGCRIRERLSSFSSPFEAREWIVRNVKGYGYKEASHFLRNIGIGEQLAILDRHILKNLKLAGAIQEVPSSLSRKKYLEIERIMTDFSRLIGIPMPHLDLLLWFMEAGEVFK